VNSPVASTKFAGFVVHIAVPVEQLRISRFVAAIVRIGLHEPHGGGQVATHHRFVATIRVALVTGVQMRLERAIDAASSIATQGSTSTIVPVGFPALSVKRWPLVIGS